ncbi:hypothetical protein PFISCL1PPCAC_25296, partial [Pristionchus fissidentatus]
ANIMAIREYKSFLRPKLQHFIVSVITISVITFILHTVWHYRNLPNLYAYKIGRAYGSSSQLSHDIDCDRIFSGDVNYTKEVALHRTSLRNETLDMTCEAINNRFSAAPSYNDVFPIAHAKIIYQDYQFLEQQMWNSYTINNWYCFAMDSK